MNVLITCDSYKDCLSAREVGESLLSGMLSHSNEINYTHVPIADGGEGSLNAIQSNGLLKWVSCESVDPLHRTIQAGYLWQEQEKLAYIEMAKASGIELLSNSERSCMETSSFGTGLLIKDAIDAGCQHFIFFIGGSATSDMGIGMLSALGVKFYDQNNKIIPFPKGKDLPLIHRMDDLESLKSIQCTLVCDVDNPLYGRQGASYVYGPQKGASETELKYLDNGMRHLNRLIVEMTGQDFAFANGAGAAGGIGVMAMYAFDTNVIGGASFMMEHLRLNDKINQADLIITGEGKMDLQTLNGKLIHGISKQVRDKNKKMIVVCGLVELKHEDMKAIGIIDSYSLAHLNNFIPYSPESTRQDLHKVGRMIAEKHLTG